MSINPFFAQMHIYQANPFHCLQVLDYPVRYRDTCVVSLFMCSNPLSAMRCNTIFSYIFDVIAIACEMNGLILLSGILFNCLFRGQCCRQVIDVLFSKEEAPGFTEVLSALFLFSILLFSSEYSPNSRFLPRPSVPESADIFSVPTRKIGDCPKETPFENLE